MKKKELSKVDRKRYLTETEVSQAEEIVRLEQELETTTNLLKESIKNSDKDTCVQERKLLEAKILSFYKQLEYMKNWHITGSFGLEEAYNNIIIEYGKNFDIQTHTQGKIEEL